MSRVSLSVLMAVLILIIGQARADTLRIYIDADYSISKDAADAIELGIRTALDEVGSQVAGHIIEIVPQNHQANSKRSFRTMQAFLEDPSALALFGGMHSPPYLTYKDYINQNRLLTLLPWSAAGPITRASFDDENWIFRLSVDDSKAGQFLIDQAYVHGDCRNISLLLMDTGWGRANLKTMSAALRKHGLAAAYSHLFPATISQHVADYVARNVAAASADCVILLATAQAGIHLTHSLHRLEQTPRIFSHWAILGRDYPRNVSHKVRAEVDLRVLQTCGLRVEQTNKTVLVQALENAAAELGSLADVSAPTGFVHGYDLTRIMIAATRQASQTTRWHKSIEEKRAAVKEALEALVEPVQGILRTYNRPFQRYHHKQPDAHEALGAADLCMAAFRRDGKLRDASQKP